MNIKRIKKILIALVIFILLLALIPIKFPVKSSEISKIKTEEEILICENIETTGPEWLVRGNKNGEIKKDGELVILVGNTPDKYLTEMMIHSSENKYLIEGIELGRLSGKFWGEDEKFRVIFVTKWNVVDKVDRLICLIPVNYLTFFDFRH